MAGAAVRALGGLLACLALVVPCRASTGQSVERAVPYGGQFTAEQAGQLAWAAAWLAGLERMADTLAGVDAVRLAGLNASQRQALAARLGLVEVTAASGPARAGAEGEARAEAGLRQPDATELSRLLADTEGRDRREEVLVALARLLPEGLDLAAKGHELRFGGPKSLSGEAAASQPADELVAGRLDWVAAQVEAYRLYLELLEQAEDESPVGTLAGLEKALALAPHAWPLRLAQAEALLRQDRFRAALQALRELPPRPVAGDAGEGTDRRLYVRALQLRALSQLRSGQPTLAESDLDEALAQAPERAELWLARGAARQMRENFAAMCEDYYQACARGQCQGLAAARARGQCASGTGG